MDAPLPRRSRRRCLAIATARLLPGVLAVSLVGPALDLLGSAQHVTALEPAALLACTAAVVAQAAWLALRPRTAWLGASLATSASVAVRLGGSAEGPALALLGVVALAMGGAMRSHSASTEGALSTEVP